MGYCDKDILLEREQYYLNILNPAYNILKIAGSNAGHKQSEETILKKVNTFTEKKKIRETLEVMGDFIKPIKGINNDVKFPKKGSARLLEIIELMRKNHSRSKIVYEYKGDKVTLIAKYDPMR